MTGNVKVRHGRQCAVSYSEAPGEQFFPSFCHLSQRGPFGHTALKAELQPGRFDTCCPKALRLILALPLPDYKAGLLPRSLMSQPAQIPDVLSGHSPLTGPATDHHTPGRGDEKGAWRPQSPSRGLPGETAAPHLPALRPRL